MYANQIFSLIATGVILGACAQETVEAKPSCDTELHQNLIGKNIGEVTLPPQIVKRVMQDGDPATMDFNPERLNIIVDDKGWIEKVYCG